MRAIVLAYNEMGYRCLETLLRAGVDVCAVFSHEDDPGEERWFRSVAELAVQHRLQLHTPDSVNEEPWVERIAALAPDLIFSFYYRRLVRMEILRVARIGAFNLHGSLLPHYRGRCPVNWALIHGEERTGVTLHEMTKRPDAGPIVGQREVGILPEDNALSLSIKLSEAATELLEECLPALRTGQFPRRIQDLDQGSYFGGRTAEDGRIDWRRPSSEIHNLVRAVTRPWPGAFTELDGQRLLIWESETDSSPGSGAVGTIASTPDLAVTCGGGRLILRRWQLEVEKGRYINQRDPSWRSWIGRRLGST